MPSHQYAKELERLQGQMKKLFEMREIELKLENGSVLWTFEGLVCLETEKIDGVEADVRVQTPGFQGHVRYYFFMADLLGFFAELKKCHSALEGSATLQLETGAFKLTVALKERGHVEAHGTLGQEYAETELSFHLKGDQSYLHEFFRSIGEPAR